MTFLAPVSIFLVICNLVFMFLQYYYDKKYRYIFIFFCNPKYTQCSDSETLTSTLWEPVSLILNPKTPRIWGQSLHVGGWRRPFLKLAGTQLFERMASLDIMGVCWPPFVCCLFDPSQSPQYNIDVIQQVSEVPLIVPQWEV